HAYLILTELGVDSVLDYMPRPTVWYGTKTNLRMALWYIDDGAASIRIYVSDQLVFDASIMRGARGSTEGQRREEISLVADDINLYRRGVEMVKQRGAMYSITPSWEQYLARQADLALRARNRRLVRLSNEHHAKRAAASWCIAIEEPSTEPHILDQSAA